MNVLGGQMESLERLAHNALEARIERARLAYLDWRARQMGGDEAGFEEKSEAEAKG